MSNIVKFFSTRVDCFCSYSLHKSSRHFSKSSNKPMLTLLYILVWPSVSFVRKTANGHQSIRIISCYEVTSKQLAMFGLKIKEV
jgi:hypothetical protein